MTYYHDTNEGDLSGRCGGCGSRNLFLCETDGTTHAVCGECLRFQELETRDWPTSKMCDNCAFRKGSPERADPEKWNDLMWEVMVRETPFYCHKGLAAKLNGQTVTFEEPPKHQRHECAGWAAMLHRKYRNEERISE